MAQVLKPLLPTGETQVEFCSPGFVLMEFFLPPWQVQ